MTPKIIICVSTLVLSAFAKLFWAAAPYILFLPAIFLKEFTIDCTVLGLKNFVILVVIGINALLIEVLAICDAITLPANAGLIACAISATFPGTNITFHDNISLNTLGIISTVSPAVIEISVNSLAASSPATPLI